MGLPTNENHLNFRWCEPGCKVLFSVCQQGSAASCHFASDKPGMKKIIKAINEFCEFVFWMFDWCKIIMAKINIRKIENIVIKCGFYELIRTKGVSVYIKERI